VGAQEVRWDKGDILRVGDFTFFYGKVNEDHPHGTGILLHHRKSRVC
jgi:hypothetical protein